MNFVRQIPNLLGVFRVITTPVLAYLIMLQTGWALISAAVLLFVMAMSDIVDGNLARRLGVVSPLGIISIRFQTKSLSQGRYCHSCKSI